MTTVTANKKENQELNSVFKEAYLLLLSQPRVTLQWRGLSNYSLTRYWVGEVPASPSLYTLYMHDARLVVLGAGHTLSPWRLSSSRW